MSPSVIVKTFNGYAQSSEPVSFEVLASFFDNLESIPPDQVVGEWKGGVIKSGKVIELTLKDYWIIKWAGKSFINNNKVKALIFSFLGIKFNFPIIGNARLRQVEYDGVVSTAMIYNHLPIIDHFRKVDNTALMGAMDFKGKTVLYFYLCK